MERVKGRLDHIIVFYLYIVCSVTDWCGDINSSSSSSCAVQTYRWISVRTMRFGFLRLFLAL